MSSRIIPREKASGCLPWKPAALAPVRSAGASAGSQADPEQARERGYAEGFEQGLRAGMEAARKQLTEQAKQITHVLASADQALIDVGEKLSREVADLAFAIARQVVRYELTLDKEAVLPLVREALSALPEGTQYGQLMLHPADATVVRDALGDELADKQWRLVEDRSLSPGGCRIVAPCGDINATLEMRWARVETALRHPPSSHEHEAERHVAKCA